VSGPGGFDAAYAMKEALRRELLRAARADGAGVHERRLWGSAVTVPMAEPLAGIRYARIAQDVAAGLVKDYAAAARADGLAWLQIADALGITEGDGYDRGTEAFSRVAENLVSGYNRSFYWRCQACGNGITDYGPFESNPVSTQSGHAEACARLAADVARYRADWGDDE
jgi:hypothetical protein